MLMETGLIQISMYTNQIFVRKTVEWLYAEKRAAFTNNNDLQIPESGRNTSF